MLSARAAAGLSVKLVFLYDSHDDDDRHSLYSCISGCQGGGAVNDLKIRNARTERLCCAAEQIA